MSSFMGIGKARANSTYIQTINLYISSYASPIVVHYQFSICSVLVQSWTEQVLNKYWTSTEQVKE